jgi:ankyrin repeat protein
MATTTRSSWYELRDAIAGRDFTIAATWVQGDPDLNKKTNGIGETVLHFLAVENDALGVAWLHEQGADINCENDFGIPAWFEVAQLGYRELLMWFVQAGVNLNATDRDEQGILTFLTAMGESEMVEFVVSSVAHKTWRV